MTITSVINYIYHYENYFQDNPREYPVRILRILKYQYLKFKKIDGINKYPKRTTVVPRQDIQQHQLLLSTTLKENAGR